MAEPAVSEQDVTAFLRANFTGPSHPEILEMEKGRARIAYDCTPADMRPGDLISGPTQMNLADTVTYVCVFSLLGIVPMAVTASLNISFLRPARGNTLTAEARLLKQGRSLIVMDCNIHAGEVQCAHAVVTYAVPQ